MSDRELADLRLDLRDLPGVIFVATVGDEPDVRIQLAVDDPGVVPTVRRGADELARRHLGTTARVELQVAGVRRSPLALADELRSVPGVGSVDVVRGPRGELLHVAVLTTSPGATAAVRDVLDRRLGDGSLRRRTEVTEVADSRA